MKISKCETGPTNNNNNNNNNNTRKYRLRRAYWWLHERVKGPRAVGTSARTQRDPGALESLSRPNKCSKRQPLSIPMAGEERTGSGRECQK